MESPSVWREWIEMEWYFQHDSMGEGSPSVWREWIEISQRTSQREEATSPSVWREWIEIRLGFRLRTRKRSPSVWREWIEMTKSLKEVHLIKVSLRVEGVD